MYCQLSRVLSGWVPHSQLLYTSSEHRSLIQKSKAASQFWTQQSQQQIQQSHFRMHKRESEWETDRQTDRVRTNRDRDSTERGRQAAVLTGADSRRPAPLHISTTLSHMGQTLPAVTTRSQLLHFLLCHSPSQGHTTKHFVPQPFTRTHHQTLLCHNPSQGHTTKHFCHWCQRQVEKENPVHCHCDNQHLFQAHLPTENKKTHQQTKCALVPAGKLLAQRKKGEKTKKKVMPTDKLKR